VRASLTVLASSLLAASTSSLCARGLTGQAVAAWRAVAVRW
jgi:hypothetical protein